jgi:hypothetical protein
MRRLREWNDLLVTAISNGLSDYAAGLQRTKDANDQMPYFWWRMGALAVPPIVGFALLWWFR